MKFKLAILLISLSLALKGQIQNPPNIHWKTIQSKHFEVIFPNEIEKKAQQTINILEHIYNADTKTLGVKPKKISLILANQSTISNGYAALMPRKMVWYTTPIQSSTALSSSEWFTTLAIHEFRHVVQYQSNNQNFTNMASILWGQMAQAGLRWSIPIWWFEGDATYAETVLSNSGRGRTPQFEMPLRTILLSGQKFSYDCASLGSYKKYYPSAYQLGYFITTYARRKYGPNIWINVMDRTTNISFFPFAFSRSLRKYTRLNVKNAYRKTMLELDSIWTSQLKSIPLTEAKIINTKPKRVWTNYLNPIALNNGNFLVRKLGMKDVNSWYLLSENGSEKFIKTTDAQDFKFSNNFVTWERMTPDTRWGEKDFSDIMIMNLENNKIEKFTKKGKYFSPCLSPDASRIVAVEYSPNLECALVIFDRNSGKKTDSIFIAEDHIIRTPAWSDDGKKIAFVQSDINGLKLTVIDIYTKEVEDLIPYTWENISRPVFYENYIIHNSEYSGIGNIYAIDLISKKRYQITSRKFGAYHPSISADGKKLLFQDYNAKGYDVAQIELNPSLWKPIEEINPLHTNYFEPLLDFEQGGSIVDAEKIPKNQYDVKKFNHFRNSINIHSWGFYPGENNLNFLIYSTNKLNTLNTVAGYAYEPTNQTSVGSILVQYSKYYPVIDFGASYGERNDIYPTIPEETTDKWLETAITAGITIPLNLSRGTQTTLLDFTTSGIYKNIKDKELRFTSEPTNGDFYAVQELINFSSFNRMAPMDIFPKFGITSLNGGAYTPQNTGKLRGHQFFTLNSLYLPGIIRHHSLKLQFAYENNTKFDEIKKDHYYFATYIAPARGYDLVTYEKYYKVTAEYHLPLFYPDFSFGPIVYLKRIKASAFFDYAQGEFMKETDNYQSVGGSITFYINVLRLNYTFEIGIRYSQPLIYNGFELNPKGGVLEPIVLGIPF